MCKCELEIEKLRQQLIDAAQNYGMQSENTIKLSCKLDVLINEYEKNKLQKRRLELSE
ncbi:aspartyl-phosphate phosphatase Spo0E family protein [Sporosarcina ureae]|uniref:aspartyl-phosphate phosphatase Spo0E family protein n=1 Tax=Sporosarcina ureae TaxID=1571 RepID=UPI0026F04745|nr:aspartyl-phosphate phosphatase Spo0E family protein [Sporosarcina ureae]